MSPYRRRYGRSRESTGAWDNTSFIKAFTYGGLGRKRQYGNLYVVDRENGFQFLMKKSTCSGTPSLEAIAIPVDNGRIVMYAWNADEINHDALKQGLAIRTGYLRHDIDFTDSRVVDVAQRQDGHRAILLWISGQFLLWDWIPEAGSSLLAKDWLDPAVCSNTPVLFKLKGEFYTSVLEARRSLLPQEVVEANAQVIQDRLAIVPTKETIPAIEDVVDMGLANTVPWPWDYGIPEHLCRELLDVEDLVKYQYSYREREFPTKYKPQLEAYYKACVAHREERNKIGEKFPMFHTRKPVSGPGFEFKVKCLASAVPERKVAARVYVTPEGDMLVEGDIYQGDKSSSVSHAKCWTTHKVVILRAEIISDKF